MAVDSASAGVLVVGAGSTGLLLAQGLKKVFLGGLQVQKMAWFTVDISGLRTASNALYSKRKMYPRIETVHANGYISSPPFQMPILTSCRA